MDQDDMIRGRGRGLQVYGPQETQVLKVDQVNFIRVVVFWYDLTVQLVY